MAYWFVTRDVNWHLQQADAGNHIIQFQVGRAYISGTDVAQDIPKGLDYITKSAEGDFIPAQITLGLSYLRGTYVEQDPAKGFSWLYKAAEQNDPSAQFMVGACYNDGNGVEKMQRPSNGLSARQTKDMPKPNWLQVLCMSPVLV